MSDDITPDEQETTAPKKATRKKTEPDPYKDHDHESFSHVLTLATGELAGTTSTASTEHWSPKLKANVPVVGVLAK